MAYEHLRLEKESPVTDRHRQRGFGAPAPADPVPSAPRAEPASAMRLWVWMFAALLLAWPRLDEGQEGTAAP